MSIKLCQAANSVVTPLDDAQLYSWVANRAVGVVAGCAVTSAGTNQLSIAAGWGIVQGHVFTVGAQTISATVAPSGTVNGRLLIRIDTSDTVTPVEFVTQAETPLPALTQQSIDGSGSIYELALATYTVGTISISGLTNVAPTAYKNDVAHGIIEMYAGAAAPAGWLLCNGANISRTTYAALFAVLGTTYGAGDGSTTFALPDMRGRVGVGIGASGVNTLGQKGGKQTHVLSENEMPVHKHGKGGYATAVGTGDNYYAGVQAPTVYGAGNTENAGGGLAHINMQPYIGINYIIKT